MGITTCGTLHFKLPCLGRKYKIRCTRKMLDALATIAFSDKLMSLMTPSLHYLYLTNNLTFKPFLVITCSYSYLVNLVLLMCTVQWKTSIHTVTGRGRNNLLADVCVKMYKSSLVFICFSTWSVCLYTHSLWYVNMNPIRTQVPVRFFFLLQDEKKHRKCSSAHV